MPSMTEYTTVWNNYNLTVYFAQGPLTVKCKDADSFARWLNMQASLYLQQTNTLQTFC